MIDNQDMQQNFKKIYFDNISVQNLCITKNEEKFY